MYKHIPLREHPPEIRLVTIEKAESPEAPIHMRLEHVDFHFTLQYYALSYTWDSPGPGFPADWGDGSTRTIRIDDQDFPVRLNLFSAIESLRLRGFSGAKFWIDAICIYSDRSRMKHCRNLRFEPPFCEGIDLQSGTRLRS